MEMNTRLQVEHPVTELITGIDLVAAQIRVAEGHPLPWKQDDIRMNGHAVESRVYAEDPSNNFLPAPGFLEQHSPPAGFGVRLDAGVEEGSEIPMYYDPMISKLSTWGSNRQEAIARMSRALEEYQITGVPTTIPFCHFVMNHESFTSGHFSTHFVADHFSGDALRNTDPDLERDLAMAAALYVDAYHSAKNGSAKPVEVTEVSRWQKNRRD